MNTMLIEHYVHRLQAQKEGLHIPQCRTKKQQQQNVQQTQIQTNRTSSHQISLPKSRPLLSHKLSHNGIAFCPEKPRWSFLHLHATVVCWECSEIGPRFEILDMNMLRVSREWSLLRRFGWYECTEADQISITTSGISEYVLKAFRDLPLLRDLGVYWWQS